jgi:hypothetical protein
MIGPDEPRRHGLTPLQAFSIAAASIAFLYALAQLLPWSA